MNACPHTFDSILRYVRLSAIDSQTPLGFSPQAGCRPSPPPQDRIRMHKMFDIKAYEYHLGMGTPPTTPYPMIALAPILVAFLDQFPMSESGAFVLDR